MIKLVPFEIKHKKDLIRNLNNINIAKWLLAPPYPYTEKDADEFLKKCTLNKNRKEESIFAIENEGVFIGGISIRTDISGNAQTGYYIDEDHWNNGYGTMALKRILGYGFETHNVNLVRAMIFCENKASEKILLKCGFKFEKESEPVIRIGRKHKTGYYVISGSDYNETNQEVKNKF